MKFEVLVSAWNGYGGGVHEEARPSKQLLRELAGAESAGVVKVTASRDERSQLGKHVQSQADGEKARAAAQKDGSWHEANFLQIESEIAAGVREPLGPPTTLEEYVEARRGSTDESGEVTRA